jgi:hypothetical membrane protein
MLRPLCLALILLFPVSAIAFRHRGRRDSAFLLAAAILVPVFYFGAQAAAAPFFPGYDILTTSASDLGSAQSSRPWILNAGALLAGAAAFLGSMGLTVSLPRIGSGRIAAFAFGLCVASAGMAACWAGLHPLPSPQHDPGALAFGMFVQPFVAVWVAWRVPSARTLRIVLALDAAAFAGMAFVMSNPARFDLSACGGLLQKLLAVLSFAPVAIVAGVAMRRSRLAAATA